MYRKEEIVSEIHTKQSINKENSKSVHEMHCVERQKLR
jgi:hypothetical protein